MECLLNLYDNFFFLQWWSGYFWKSTANTFAEKHVVVFFFTLLVLNANIHLINLIQGGIGLQLGVYKIQSLLCYYLLIIVLLFI